MKSTIIKSLEKIKQLLENDISKDNREDIINHINYLSEDIANSKITFIPDYEDWVWIVDPEERDMVYEMEWKGTKWQFNRLINGGVYLTKESALKAAKEVKSALWGFEKKEM